MSKMFVSGSESPAKRGQKVLEEVYYFEENPMLDCNQFVINDRKTRELALFDSGNGISLKNLFEGMKRLGLNYQNKKILIPGDLVFTGGSFGRYDFPGGSLDALIESIKFVNELDVKYLLPGHMGISDNGNQQIDYSYKMVQSLKNFF